VVLAASTREGEEGPLLQRLAALPVPRPLLLLVPRHPQRFDEVAQLAAQAGLPGCGAAAGPTMPPPKPLMPMSGSATAWARCRCTTRCADVALLGGSFAPLGGRT
jgi:3-deoxy-D-manno-octulosonic-acid transferase